MPIESVGSPALWVGFTVFVLAMLALDLGVFHRRAHEVRAAGGPRLERRSGSPSRCSSTCLVLHWFGAERALEFLTGYLIEKALSVDNIFVFLVIFSFFAVPAALQHRVLFWGILGALVMRAVFIVAGRGAAPARSTGSSTSSARSWSSPASSCSRQRGERGPPGAEPRPAALPAPRARRRPSYHGAALHGRREAAAGSPRRCCWCWSWSRPPTSSSPSTRSRRSSPSPPIPFIVYTSNIFAILGPAGALLPARRP